MNRFARGLELLGGADMEVEVKEKGETKKVRIIPAAHLPGLFRDVFRNAFLKFRDGRILTLFLTEVNGFAYSHSEELGNAFEYALQCMGTQGENGQFRTPRHIIDFIVACLDPQPGESILDPACGTGGFLVSAYKHILAKHTSPGSSLPGDRLSHTDRQKVYAGLTGYDITDLMVKLSKVNLFLHGFPDPAIHIYDTLSNDARWHEKVDLILANPPFMTPKGGVTPHTKFRIAAKKAEVLFTDYIAEHLSADGRGGIIVPNGIVATTQNAYVKLRRFLVEDSLVAVVSLPSGVFKPYSGVKTSILFLDKKLARQTQEVLFLKITADGFDLGDQRREIEANDLPEAERVVKAWLKGQTAGAEGAGFRAKGPSSSQPGPTAQEPGTKTRQGLKARAMPAAMPLVHESGLQPSAVIADDTPGALPQAGMGSAVGAGVVWKRVEKTALLENRACSLQAETFFGEKAADSTVEMVVLGDVAKLGNGGTPSKANPAFWKGDIPWVSPKDMKSLVITDTEDHVSMDAVESSATKLLPADTVLCVVRSGILKHTLPLAITARPMCTNQDILAITPDRERLDPKFLLFVLRGRSTEILRDGIKTGVTVESFHNGFFKTFEIPLPPLEEQRRIVAEIEGYQKVLDGAHQILDALQPTSFSELDAPLVALGTVCKVCNGFAFKSEEYVEDAEGLRIIRIANVQKGQIVDDRPKFYAKTRAAEFEKYEIAAGDLLMSLTGNVGRVGLMPPEMLPALLNQRVAKLIPDQTQIHPRFLFYILNDNGFEAAASSNATGAAQQNLSTRWLEGYEIPLPPLEEQRRIVSELDAEAAQMEAVRGLIPRFEAKIQRVLDRVWGTTAVAE